MSYRPIQRILVPLDPSRFSEAATARACEVARSHFAQVSGVTVLDTPEITCRTPVGEVFYWPIVYDTVEHLTADARARIGEEREKFASACEINGVTHTESELEGVPASEILQSSVLYDLIVMGLRTSFHFSTREGPGDSLARVLGRTVTPVLAVPQASPETEPQPFRKVAVAYDGSFSAGRALRDFIGFATPYEFEITVLTASNDERQANALLQEAASCLRSHEVKNFETVHVTSDALTANDEHLEQADLIVTGIHSRQVMKDLFVGSFTTSLIEKGDTALFLSH